MENQVKNNSTVIAYTYRYIWKTKDGLCVRYITDTLENHAKFCKALCEDSNVISAMREYQNEVNYAYIAFTEPVKNEKKESDNNEEKSC